MRSARPQIDAIVPDAASALYPERVRRSLVVAVAMLAIAGGMSGAANARTISGCAIRAGTNCPGADLHRAALRKAVLRNAVLRRANLRDADLRGADLRSADLRGADLRRADLRNADLRNARLTGARLTGSRLANALIAGTILASRPAPTGSTAGSGSSTGSGAASGGPAALPSPSSLALPWASPADIERVGPKVTSAWASANGAPFVAHNGIDFIAVRDLVPFKAMTAASVSRVDTYVNALNGNEQVNVIVDAGGGYTMVYTFEPMAPGTGAAQLAQIDVQAGQTITAGATIGRLVKAGGAAHLHVHMLPPGGGDSICLADRWSAADQALVVAKLTSPFTQLCYG